MTEKQVVTFWHSMGGIGQETLNSIVEEYNNSQDKVQVNAEFQGTYDESLTKFNTVAGTDRCTNYDSRHLKLEQCL